MSTLDNDMHALVARFEEGVSADPTKNMSPEDAKKWQEMNEEHGDKFKTAAYGDPYWMTAKYPGKAQDGTPVKKGDKVFYYPRTKTMLVGPKAEAAAREFGAMSFDEDFGARAAMHALASLDLELTASALPGVGLDKDAAALEAVAKLASLDRAADQMIGKTILEQMGGQRRLGLMLGVKQFLLLKDGVAFKWPNKQSNKGNYVEIRLNGSDLYDMTFYKVMGMGGVGTTEVKAYDDLYAENLAPTFERQTGWHLRMASQQAHLLVKAANSEGQMAKFEEGVSADPTKNMSPEDAAEWKKQNEANKDKFKTAAPGDMTTGMFKFNVYVGPITEHLAAIVARLAKAGIKAKSGTDSVYGVMEAESEFGPPEPHHAMNKFNKIVGYKLISARDLNKSFKKLATDLMAEGCPDNLDEGECAEWEANTEKYKDVVKDKAAVVPIPSPDKVKHSEDDDEDSKKTAYEEGSRVPDGWDNGHIEGKEHTDKPGEEGSQIPDGEGNQKKRAGEVIDEMYALVTTDGDMLGATDDWMAARNKSYWRHFGTEDQVADSRLRTLKKVPLHLAEKFKDVGTSAQTFSDGYAAWEVAYKYFKGVGMKLAETMSEDDDGGKYAARKEAATGLYGHTKRLQADCEGCVRRVQKSAADIARNVHARNEKVAEFLATHARRADSLSAKILVAALQGLGPKVASEIATVNAREARLVELRTAAAAPQGGPQTAIMAYLANYPTSNLTDFTRIPELRGVHFAKIMSATEALKKKGLVSFDGVKVTKLAKVTDGDAQTGEGIKETTDKNAAQSYGLYGYSEKVAKLGLRACADLRHEAGKIAHDLHKRRMAHHAAINDFFANHSKKARCMYSKLLSASYPELPKTASSAPPRTVQAWLEWEPT